MSDLILLHGVEVEALIGVYDFERVGPQPLVELGRAPAHLEAAGQLAVLAQTPVDAGEHRGDDLVEPALDLGRRAQRALVRHLNLGDRALRALRGGEQVRGGLVAAAGLVEEAGQGAKATSEDYARAQREELLTQLGVNSLDELPPISPLLPDGEEEQ